MKCRTKSGKRSGFSLVELVVVVLIMGIMAAVAAPKLFNKMDDAKNSSARQSLSVVRAAIDQYALDNEGSWPADPSAAAFVKNYLRGSFPKVEGGDNAVTVTSTGTLTQDDAVSTSWLYDSSTGELRINESAKFAW